MAAAPERNDETSKPVRKRMLSDASSAAIDQDCATLRALGKANREVRRHGGDTQAAFRGEDRGDVSRLTSRRCPAAEPQDFFERGDEVLPLDRTADELEGARTDDLDDKVGRRALSRGKDGRSGQGARQ